MKKLIYFIANDGKPFTSEEDCLAYDEVIAGKEQPYHYEASLQVEKSYNKAYKPVIECICDHSYDRHFDPYEDYLAVGCKYCGCQHFTPKIFSNLIEI